MLGAGDEERRRREAHREMRAGTPRAVAAAFDLHRDPIPRPDAEPAKSLRDAAGLVEQIGVAERRTVRPLGDENDKAFALINALNAEQQKQAILSFEVRNLVLGPGVDGKTISPEGARISTFTAAQRAMLVDLVREWVEILSDEAAAAKMKEVQAGLDDTYFAWAGSTSNGNGAYFRIQGPTVVIEYAPQGGTDHIHTVIRNPEDDYGAGLLKR